MGWAESGKKTFNDVKIMDDFVNQKCQFTEGYMESASNSYQVKLFSCKWVGQLRWKYVLNKNSDIYSWRWCAVTAKMCNVLQEEHPWPVIR